MISLRSVHVHLHILIVEVDFARSPLPARGADGSIVILSFLSVRDYAAGEAGTLDQLFPRLKVEGEYGLVLRDAAILGLLRGCGFMGIWMFEKGSAKE